jgi:DNA-3-methyladenine glycosylase
MYVVKQPTRVPSTEPTLGIDFFDQDVLVVAKALIGVSFKCEGVGGLIVETEAYRNDDAASHSFRGETLRNRVMFGPPAHAYVYRSYGLHWCFNMTCGKGSAVLVRGIEPLFGVDKMAERRRVSNRHLLCSGPGRLTQALGIDDRMNGMGLFSSPFMLCEGIAAEVVVGKRIGITRAQDNLWRFGMRGSRFHSRKF